MKKVPLQRHKNCHQAFKDLKTELSQIPSIGLPNLNKPFTLYIHEKQRRALEVLTQKLGPNHADYTSGEGTPLTHRGKADKVSSFFIRHSGYHKECQILSPVTLLPVTEMKV
ncbi:Pol polyprotein [Plecturocebus cupreus]